MECNWFGDIGYLNCTDVIDIICVIDGILVLSYAGMR